MSLVKVEELYEKHGPYLYKYLLRLSGDPDLSEDLVQESFYQIIKSIDRYDASCHITTWMCQIAKHMYLREVTKRKKRPLSIVVDDDRPDKTDIERAYISREQADEIMNIINRLPEEERVLVSLRLFDDMAFKTIGQILGKSENWTRVTFFRIKKKIRRDFHA